MNTLCTTDRDKANDKQMELEKRLTGILDFYYKTRLIRCLGSDLFDQLVCLLVDS